MAIPTPLPRQIRRRPIVPLPAVPLPAVPLPTVPLPAARLSAALLAAALLLVGALVGAGPASAHAEPVPRGEWPLAPAPDVVTGFDPPASDWGSGHRGVDLLGTAGQPVRAALPGRVSFAGRIAGRGIVVVDHGDTRTTYEPVHASREVGAEVRAGQRIGVLEIFASHCFPHSCLHWGWVRGSTYLDPLLLVGAGPVRLLPLGGAPPLPPSMHPLPSPPSMLAAGWDSPAGPWTQARGCACW